MGRSLRFTLVAIVAATLAAAAGAQVPPHLPGTVCLTPYFWCWATAPGEPGAPCVCVTSSGPVEGVLG